MIWPYRYIHFCVVQVPCRTRSVPWKSWATKQCDPSCKMCCSSDLCLELFCSLRFRILSLLSRCQPLCVFCCFYISQMQSILPTDRSSRGHTGDAGLLHTLCSDGLVHPPLQDPLGALVGSDRGRLAAGCLHKVQNPKAGRSVEVRQRAGLFRPRVNF